MKACREAEAPKANTQHYQHDQTYASNGCCQHNHLVTLTTLTPVCVSIQAVLGPPAGRAEGAHVSLGARIACIIGEETPRISRAIAHANQASCETVGANARRRCVARIDPIGDVSRRRRPFRLPVQVVDAPVAWS